MNCVTLAGSLTGSVLGMHATAVKPPATADAVPVAMVSLCSCPGSRRWTWMSIKPGATIHPDSTAITSAPSAGNALPIFATRPPSISTSNSPSRFDAGSTTRPPFSSNFISFASLALSVRLRFLAGEQIQHGHPDRHAVGDLLEDDRVRPVGDIGVDLDPAVHGAGVHDDDVGPCAGGSCRREAARRG